MQSNVNILKGMSFDSSLSSIDDTVSDEKYKERITSLLRTILEERFPNNLAKQDIRPYRDRISFACPYCGDSMKNDYKKRGNFILIGKFAGHFKCHNCGEFKRIDRFFSDFKVNLDLSVINYIAKGIENFASNSNVKYDMSLFLDKESIDKYAISRQDFLEFFNLVEVKDSAVWPWLKHRMQYDSSKFLYNANKNHLIILNLTHTGKILGAQKRLFKGANKYLTFRLSKIYELMGKDSKEVPDEINSISQIFNICLLNYSKPVTLFEGPFDAFLFKNSIANAGANKSFVLDLPIRYFYDDDKTGKNKSIEKISQGQEVFLWTKLKHDLELPFRPKWDMNDLIIYLNEKNLNIPRLQNYFSSSELDMIDI